MYFIISIDTEEDNWDKYNEAPTYGNIGQIPILQRLFDKYSVKPTYLVTYAVASHKESASILKEINNKQKCEIGTHLHPWNTPPIREVINKKNSMLCNLPKNLQYEKLKSLHHQITEVFDASPSSFRAGRYAFGNEMAYNLERLNYSIDSSITPFVDWSGFYGPNFSKFSILKPYRFESAEITKPDKGGVLLEVPITAGFRQSNFLLANYFFTHFKKKPFKYFHLIGILDRLKLLNFIRLSPELSSTEDMISLINVMMKKEINVLNMTFHSTSLLPGCTEYVKSELELEQFLLTIEQTISRMLALGMTPITLSDVLSNNLCCS
jgi:hypothetical protein